MMIAETAALSGAQAQYLSDVKNLLDNGYPMLRGLLYFDAPGKGGTYQYPLDQSGYSEFQALASDRRFQPPVEPSTTSVSVSTSAAQPAQAVHISAKVVSDYGGSVSLYSNGSPVVGCQQLPVSASPSCTTVSLPAGTDALTAIYNGDAEYAKSVSAPTQRAAEPRCSPPTHRLRPLPALRRSAGAGPRSASRSRRRPPTRSGLAPGSTCRPAPPNSLDLWGTLLGHRGYGWAVVLVGVLLMLVGGSYMLLTWIKDERLKRRLSRP